MAAKKKASTKTEPTVALSTTEQKLEAMGRALTDVQKAFGKGSIQKFGDKPMLNINAVSTGNLEIDLSIGVGGIPCGRITEIYGPESSGKTTVALHVIAEAQKKGGICAFIDAEHALDPVYAKNIGVNIDELYISQPDNGEQALEISEMLIRSGAIEVLVIDSVAALVPKAEIEGEMGASFIGVQARLMSQALRKLSGIVSKTDTALIFINQLREKVGSSYGPVEVTPGGRALKFYSTVRLDVRRVDSFKVGQEVVGNRVKIKVVKNKVAPPFRVCEFDIIFGEGISREGTLLDMAVARDIIKKSGSWFSYDDIKIGQGRENARIFLKENPDIFKTIEETIKAEVINNKNVVNNLEYDDDQNEDEEDPDLALIDELEV